MSDQEPTGEKPKLHIDADWKAEAQAEKQRLAEQSGAQDLEGEGGAGGKMPPADFRALISGLATQAMLYMGMIPDPMTGQRIAHLELARHHVDLLGVLEAKTQGNLDDEEQKLLAGALNDLRLSYTQLSQEIARQVAAGKLKPGEVGALGMSGPAPGGQGDPGPGPGSPPIHGA